MVSLTYNLLDINISLISFGKNFTFPCNSSDIYFKNLLGIVIFSEMKITVQNQWFCSSAENMKLADNTNKLFLLQYKQIVSAPSCRISILECSLWGK